MTGSSAPARPSGTRRTTGHADESAGRLRRHRGALRARQRSASAPATPNAQARRHCPTSPALQRLQGALRRQVRRPGDHRRPAVRQGDRRLEHHRPGRQLRLPRLRRRAREEHARQGRADAGERRPRDVRLHLGRARQPHARRRRLRAGREPTTSSSSPTTTRRSRRSSSGCDATGSTRATRSSSSPSTRATTSPAATGHARPGGTARSPTPTTRARRRR